MVAPVQLLTKRLLVYVEGRRREEKMLTPIKLFDVEQFMEADACKHAPLKLVVTKNRESFRWTDLIQGI
jgi:hypothetical protein